MFQIYYCNSNIDSISFKSYFKLISVLLIAEQTKQLLLKSHDLRLVSTTTIPEVNSNFKRNFNRFIGYEWEWGRGAQKGSSWPTQYNKSQQRNTFVPNHDRGNKPMRKHDENAFSRYGMDGH